MRSGGSFYLLSDGSDLHHSGYTDFSVVIPPPEPVVTTTETLSATDLDQLSRQGISTDEIERQLEIFRRPPPPARLIRSCRLDDGIVWISAAQERQFEQSWRTMARRRRLVKFVPASGVATRMFKDLTASATKDDSQPTASRFLESLPRFAFAPALESALAVQGLDVRQLAATGDLAMISRYLLEPAGLNYRRLPKGLVLFHTYPEGTRSSLEEHLWEGAGYLSPDHGNCRFHFTVAAEYLPSFQQAVDRWRGPIESALDITLETGFSTQNAATDTLAVDPENRPFRTSDGRLLLRPSGHGALLENLQNLDADVAFIKNIDNVAHRRLHPTVVRWKRILAGYFYHLQEEAFALLDQLESAPRNQHLQDQAMQWIGDNLTVEIPAELRFAGAEKRYEYLIRRLDRPFRVCGMVRNVGEPGGGPFWLADSDGALTGQIVERAQVDFESPEQAELWANSTHFNPTDLICGLRTRNGEPYDLAQFVDPAATFVTRKSHHGRPLKALERPGLWNGAMAGWNTVFVEVPLQTFNPVKNVFDLLRPEHQP